MSFSRNAAACLLSLSGAVALPCLAQTVTVVYAPEASSVPTLSEMGLIVTIALMGFAAFMTLRSGASGRIFSLLTIGAALMFAASQFAPPATAAPDFALSNPVGGTTVWNQTGTTAVPNTTTSALRIVSVEAGQGTYLEQPLLSPRCVPGLVVLAGQSCYVAVFAQGGQTGPGTVD